MKWKGAVENQELHLATSLTRTQGGKVSSIMVAALQILKESWMIFIVLFFYAHEQAWRCLAHG